MAARGENLGSVALTMLAFGIGTALPLLAFAALSRETLLRWRGKMLAASSGLKTTIGALLILAGILTLSGYDRTMQTALEKALPTWVIALTTRI